MASLYSTIDSISSKHNFVKVGEEHVDTFPLEKEDFDCEAFFRKHLTNSDKNIIATDFSKLQTFLPFLSNTLQNTCEEIASSVDVYLPKLKEISAVFHEIHHAHSKAEAEKENFSGVIKKELEDIQEESKKIDFALENERIFHFHEANLKRILGILAFFERMKEEIHGLDFDFDQDVEKCSLDYLQICWQFSESLSEFNGILRESESIKALISKYKANEEIIIIKESIQNINLKFLSKIESLITKKEGENGDYNAEFALELLYRSIKGLKLLLSPLSPIIELLFQPEITQTKANESELLAIKDILESENSLITRVLKAFEDEDSEFYIEGTGLSESFAQRILSKVGKHFNAAIPNQFQKNYNYCQGIKENLKRNSEFPDKVEAAFQRFFSGLNIKTYIELRKKETLEIISPLASSLIITSKELEQSLEKMIRHAYEVSIASHLDSFVAICLLSIKKLISIIELCFYSQTEKNQLEILDFVQNLHENNAISLVLGNLTLKIGQTTIAAIEEKAKMPLFDLVSSIFADSRIQLMQLSQSLSSKICEKVISSCANNLEPYNSIPVRLRNATVAPNKPSNFIFNVFKPLYKFSSELESLELNEKMRKSLAHYVTREVISRFESTIQEILNYCRKAESSEKLISFLKKQFALDSRELKHIILEKYALEIEFSLTFESNFN